MKRTLPFLLMTALILAILGLAAWRQHEAQERTDHAVAEIRTADLALITDLETGLDFNQINRHLSTLQLLADTDQASLTPGQRLDLRAAIYSLATLRLCVGSLLTRDLLYDHVKAEPQLIPLTPEQLRQLTSDHHLLAGQLLASQTAALAVKEAKQLLASCSAPHPNP